MSKYLVLYRSEKSPAEMFANVTQEQQKAFADAWTAWDKSAGKAMIDPGNPTVAVSDPKAGGDNITGYAVMEAENPEALNKLLADQPYLATGATAGIYNIMEM